MRAFNFFFSSRRRHTRLTCDWSSDVCSSISVEAPDPLRERGPQDHAVARVDLPVVVLVDDANVPGLATIPFHLHGIGGLPDAAELVVVVDRDGLADEPLVPDVILVEAEQAHDPV